MPTLEEKTTFRGTVSMRLTKQESDKLTRCEALIEQGKQAYIAAGQALMEIRDQRLYRAHYRTFEEYARVRWGISKTHANRLIAASSMAVEMSLAGVTVQNENQARRLVLMNEQQRQEAVACAKSLHGEYVSGRDVIAASAEKQEVITDVLLRQLGAPAQAARLMLDERQQTLLIALAERLHIAPHTLLTELLEEKAAKGHLRKRKGHGK